MGNILEMRGICKSFGEVQSLADGISVAENEIVGCWATTARASPR